MRSGCLAGQGASMMLSPDSPARGLTVCQISSVRKGMKGWRRRSDFSKTVINVRRAPNCSDAAVVSSHSTGLDSSRYQSQNSFHTKS